MVFTAAYHVTSVQLLDLWTRVQNATVTNARNPKRLDLSATSFSRYPKNCSVPFLPVELFQSVLGDVLNQHHEQSATFHQVQA